MRYSSRSCNASGRSRRSVRRSTRYLPALASARRCGFRAAAAVGVRMHARIPQRNRATRIALVMRERAQRDHLFACASDRTFCCPACRQGPCRVRQTSSVRTLAAHKTYGRGPQLAPANRPCNAGKQKRGNGGAGKDPRVSRLQKPGVGWLVVLETFI